MSALARVFYALDHGAETVELPNTVATLRPQDHAVTLDSSVDRSGATARLVVKISCPCGQLDTTVQGPNYGAVRVTADIISRAHLLKG